MLRPKYDLRIQYSKQDYQRILTVSAIMSRVTADIAEGLLDTITTGLNTEGIKVTKPLGEYLRVIWDNYYAMHDIVREILLIIKKEADIEGCVGFAPTIGGTVQDCDIFEADLTKLLGVRESFEILVRLKIKEV